MNTGLVSELSHTLLGVVAIAAPFGKVICPCLWRQNCIYLWPRKSAPWWPSMSHFSQHSHHSVPLCTCTRIARAHTHTHRNTGLDHVICTGQWTWRRYDAYDACKVLKSAVTLRLSSWISPSWKPEVIVLLETPNQPRRDHLLENWGAQRPSQNEVPATQRCSCFCQPCPPPAIHQSQLIRCQPSPPPWSTMSTNRERMRWLMPPLCSRTVWRYSEKELLSAIWRHNKLHQGKKHITAPWRNPDLWKYV